MKNKKVIVSLTFAILLCIFAFTDLQISHSLYEPTNKIALFLQAIGEIPAMLIALLSSMYLFKVRKNKGSRGYYLSGIGYGLIILLFAFIASFMLVKYLVISKFLIPIFMICFIAVCYMISKSWSKYDDARLRDIALIGLLSVVIVLITFNLIKLGWDRERYRHMISIGSFEGFSKWFIPQGIAKSDEFMSFPSGHSANAALVIWLSLLPEYFASLKRKKIGVWIFILIWMILVPVSRIMVGAHFASDVTVGVAISLIVFMTIKKYIWRKKKVDVQSIHESM
ncbi:phosphatase PAP2 family protein [Bacillus cereus group sp. BfR-BA-01383]|uniref:phosphatase PAP2 family protein n=1 Tax=Bacillus cereus group sp. BfR-BA-01383 TaxID=2920327 RepID=UPI001F573E91|nr:phosphatase PAP2 family protein [Bacillus cereus group sp. BfR-BA-01383]